jgi:hypothetical protein
MKNKAKQPKLITVTHIAIGVKFSPGNPSLVVVAGLDPDRLSPRLAKYFARVAKGGKSGIKLKGLGKDDRWTARFLLKIKALREMAELKKMVVPKRTPARKETGPSLQRPPRAVPKAIPGQIQTDLPPTP